MTIDEVKTIVELHNNRIDVFNITLLPKILETHGFKVTYNDKGEPLFTMNAWFKAQSIIDRMDFYDEAKYILNKFRPLGFDIKINMQTNKLIF